MCVYVRVYEKIFKASRSITISFHTTHFSHFSFHISHTFTLFTFHTRSQCTLRAYVPLGLPTIQPSSAAAVGTTNRPSRFGDRSGGGGATESVRAESNLSSSSQQQQQQQQHDQVWSSVERYSIHMFTHIYPPTLTHTNKHMHGISCPTSPLSLSLSPTPGCFLFCFG